jgi:type IV pilus assembly protein PilN
VAYGDTRKSGNAKLVGIALDNPTIAEYMTRIESSPKYANVKLLSINQDTSIKGLKLKKFNIRFQKATPKNNLKRYLGNEEGQSGFH